eukprot:1003334-Amphidinium_carterae.1
MVSFGSNMEVAHELNLKGSWCSKPFRWGRKSCSDSVAVFRQDANVGVDERFFESNVACASLRQESLETFLTKLPAWRGGQRDAGYFIAPGPL